MRWNEKCLTLKDGTSIVFHDTADFLTSGYVLYFADPVCGCRDKKAEVLAELLAEKNIAIAVLDTELFPERNTEKETCEQPDPQDVDRMTEFFYAYKKACRKEYACWIMSYARGYAARLIERAVAQDEDFPAFLSLLVKEDPCPSDPGWRCKSNWFYCYTPEYDTSVMLTGISPYSRIRYIPEDLSPDMFCQVLYSGIRPLKDKVWNYMLAENHSYEEDDPAWIRFLEAMTWDFEGCGTAAAMLHEICRKDETGQLYRESVEDSRYFLGRWLDDWPEDLFWLVAAADCRHTPSRVALFNDHISRYSLHELYGTLQYDCSNGHSFAAILLGLAAEKMLLSGDEVDAYFPIRTRDESIRLAELYYKLAASMGDSEGWYRLGKLKEYAKYPAQDPWECYEKAARENFPPALAKLAWRLEQEEHSENTLQELVDLYERITEKLDISYVWIRMGFCKEALGEEGEAFEDYESSLSSPSLIMIERQWAYSISSDFNDCVFLLDDEEEENVKAKAYYRLGMLLMEHPDWAYDDSDSPGEYFRRASAGAADRIDYWDDLGKEPDFSKWYDMLPREAQSLFQIGICRLTGREPGRDLHKTYLFFKTAADFGVKEALPYAAFLQEAETFLQEAVHNCPDGIASKEMREKEAEYHLGLLTRMGLSEEILQEYLKEKTALLLYEDGSFSLPDPDDETDREIMEEIRRMESMHDASAYLALIEDAYPVKVNLFYVSSEIGDWEFIRKQLTDREPYVYVFGTGIAREFVCEEIGPIGIYVGEGRIVRKW